jgi:hypothetical protein
LAIPERSAGAKTGWRFRVPVRFGIRAGVLLLGNGALVIFVTELLSSTHALSQSEHDAGLVVGGALIGLVALSINEIFRLEPERRHVQHERNAELQRHQEERRLDFEQFRALQSELRETQARASTLQARLDLTGALDRDRIGDALLLGFYFHRRREGLPSAPNQSIFGTAALRLKVLTDKIAEVKLDKPELHDVLEIAYGPIVSEAFDLGYILSHLGEDGFPEAPGPELLRELEQHLKALKIDAEVGTSADLSAEVRGFFKKVAARVIYIVRGTR